MKKLIGVFALLIIANFSLVGYQSYTQREERAQLQSLRTRLQATEAKLNERDNAITTLHVALTELNETIQRDSASLDAFEAKHRAGISDYKLYSDYKQRVAALNAAVKKYQTMWTQWDALDRSYTGEVRAYNMLADSVQLASTKLGSKRSLIAMPRISFLTAD